MPRPTAMKSRSVIIHATVIWNSDSASCACSSWRQKNLWYHALQGNVLCRQHLRESFLSEASRNERTCLSVDPRGVNFMFEQVGEKLCVRSCASCTASPRPAHETVKRAPNDLASSASAAPLRLGFGSPAASTTLQWVEGNTCCDLAVSPDIQINGFFQRLQKISKRRQKSKFRAARAAESLCKGKPASHKPSITIGD